MNNAVLIIVNYNDSENTINLINNVKSYKSIKKIVVVDNNSTDESIDNLRKLNVRKLHIIESIHNNGYAMGLNMGAKYAMEEYKNPILIFSNSDIVIESENTIKNLINNFKNDDIKVVMPKIKEKDNFSYGWKLTSPFQDLLMNIPGINRKIRKKYRYYEEEYFNTDTSIVDCIYGCFFLIEGEFLKKIGYFDENTFLYFEEYILGRKVKMNNKVSIVDNREFVIHNHNVSIGNNVTNINKYKIYKKSQFYYERKYNNANALIMFLFKVFYYINLIPYKITKK
ncbi:MAG: glycosyltransferase family 2 protein [Bacilli bacterium]|nr:glycosyltransferase family 2 protein [Bacilli bacterium]